MNITITMDVGGTGIKTGVFDSDTRQMIGDMFERPSLSREDKDTILNNFADIVSHAISLAPSSQVTDLRMAFPNPFDYVGVRCALSGRGGTQPPPEGRFLGCSAGILCLSS